MAELGNKKNILVGAASIYISDVPAESADITAKPAFDPTKSYRETLDAQPFAPANGGATSLTAASAWRNVGFTQEGLEVSYEPDYGDVEVDQLLDSALTFKQSMKVSINTTLAEGTLFNLMVAWGQSASTLRTTTSDAELDIASGELGEAPIERSLIAIGNGPLRSGSSYGERVYHKYRVLNVESSTHGLKRNENTAIPVSFRALPSDNGLYGRIKDRKKTW